MVKKRILRILIVVAMMAAIAGLAIKTKQKGDDAVASDKIPVSVALEQELPDPLPAPRGLPELDDILNDPKLKGATATVSVRKASDGEIIYSHLADTRVHPASVMKLLTGAAALETLGVNYTFKTELYMDGQIRNGVLHGDLYLKGQGDPTLLKKDLKTFASELTAKGIRTVNGNIYGDDSWYDDIRLSQDLNWSDEPFYTGAQVSALTLSPNKDYDCGDDYSRSDTRQEIWTSRKSQHGACQQLFENRQ